MYSSILRKHLWTKKLLNQCVYKLLACNIFIIILVSIPLAQFDIVIINLVDPLILTILSRMYVIKKKISLRLIHNRDDYFFRPIRITIKLLYVLITCLVLCTICLYIFYMLEYYSLILIIDSIITKIIMIIIILTMLFDIIHLITFKKEITT